jgi:hypothetical protein
MVVFYHLLVCPWISVEKIILTLTNFLYPFFLQIFQEILKSKMAAEVTLPPLSQKNSNRRGYIIYTPGSWGSTIPLNSKSTQTILRTGWKTNSFDHIVIVLGRVAISILTIHCNIHRQTSSYGTNMEKNKWVGDYM